MLLMIIISGFWMIQSQMYATMPKYVIRLIGEGASPGWYANVNPLVVLVFVNLITSLMQKKTALNSMMVGMFIIPLSAVVMSLGNMFNPEIAILGMHPVSLLMIVGIAMQAIAECFISPRYLEYFSLQAPEGEEGLYLGFSHLHSFFSFLFAFGVSGFLLEKYLPHPRLFTDANGVLDKVSYSAATANAHHIWYYFAAIGAISAVALIIYSIVTRKQDAKIAAEEAKSN